MADTNLNLTGTISNEVELTGEAAEFREVAREEGREAAEQAIEEGDFGGSSADIPNEQINEKLQKVNLTYDPTHTASIDTGVPSGEFHTFGDWGSVITVDQPVHWRSTDIVPESEGTTILQIYQMDYSDGETYNLRGIEATREINHGAGEQKVHPDVVLDEGQYFITRDPEQVVPMREVATDVNWDDFNTENVPVTVECSWRANAGYKPGNSEYQKYKDRNWDQLYYYFGNPKFGFMSE